MEQPGLQKSRKLKATVFDLSIKLLSVLLVLVVIFYFLVASARINSFPTYFLALVTSCCLFFSTTYHYLKDTDRQLLFVVLCLICYLGISALWSSGIGLEKQARQFEFAGSILAFLIAFTLSVRKFPAFSDYFLAAILLCASISAGLSIYLHFDYPSYQNMPEPRLYGFGRPKNPLIASAAYGFGLWVGVYLLMNSKHYSVRVVIAFCILLLFACVVLTGSRSVWCALGLSLGIGIAQTLSWKPWLVFLLVLVLTALIVSVTVEWNELLGRGWSYRPEIWNEFIARTIKRRILLGFGSASAAEWVTPTYTFLHPHSIFVSTFYYGGAIGLFILLATFASCLSVISRTDQSRAKRLASMGLFYGVGIGVFDGNNIISDVNHLWWIFWLPVAWCLVIDTNRPSAADRLILFANSKLNREVM